MRKEIPILFSTPMVQAIEKRRKTMTRRIMKPQPGEAGASYMPNAPLDWESRYREEWKPWKWDTEEGESVAKHCPYGQPGDVLWVRESFVYRDKHEKYYYKADHTEAAPYAHNGWKPSIHMPKDACRIWLEVTSVRVERLQEISPDDADMEGVERWNEDYHTEPGALHADYGNYLWKDDPEHPEYNFPSYPNPIDSFRSLWTKINGPDSWNANPWVWAVSFKVLSTTGKPGLNSSSFKSQAI